MKNLIRNKSFIIGLIFGVILFLCLNIYTIYDTPCHHCANWIGFPLPVFVEFITSSENNPFGKQVKEFYWFSIVINIFITLVFSFITGVIFRMIWSKLSSRQTNLK
jgi:xanthine/uracil permease